MSFVRETRSIGSTLSLGGISYRIDALEGRGSSAIVYQASYEDNLTRGKRHHVFIKELFPLSIDGKIYRAENGDILCGEGGEELMELSRTRFLMGNRMNLELLNQNPSGTSGNINSYEAYGTYYSVLSLHGGKNLKTLLDENGKMEITEAVSALRRILVALDIFHQQGLLHLDISPDNILLLPEQALLIDYNSVWDIKSHRVEEFVFSEKEGYSSAEIKLRKFKDIGYQTDMFSVCAVFFHMLTGRALSTEEIIGNGLQKYLAKNINVFGEIPQTASIKVVQILLKGLHLLGRKRYQNVEEFVSDLDELSRRIEGKGISHSALWESSRKLYGRFAKDGEAYIRQDIQLLSGEMGRSLSQKECTTMTEADTKIVALERMTELLRSGNQILLKGPGGMGKTRLLSELWKQNQEKYRENMPVYLYISLRDYQNYGGKPFFIRKSILQNLSFSDDANSYEDALHELEVLFAKKRKDCVNIVLLLDGYNEAGTKRELLLKEIEELGSREGVSVLLTERSGTVMEHGLKMFQAAELLSLSDETVKEVLGSAKILLPSEQNLCKMLQNPMMLGLYKRIFLLSKSNQSNSDELCAIQSVDDLVRAYLDELLTAQLRIDEGDEAMQLRHRYILKHLYPAIAQAMTRQGKTILTYDEMADIVGKSYKKLSDRGFNRHFKEFTGQSRMMLQGFKPSEWFDFTIFEQLIDKLGLLQRNESGHYYLVHDNFQKCLTKMAKENRIPLFLRRETKIVIAILSVYVILFSVPFVVDSCRPDNEIEDDYEWGYEYYLGAVEKEDGYVGVGKLEESELEHVNTYVRLDPAVKSYDTWILGYYHKSGMDNSMILRDYDSRIREVSMNKEGSRMYFDDTAVGIEAIYEDTDVEHQKIYSLRDERTQVSYSFFEAGYSAEFFVPSEAAMRVVDTYDEEGNLISEMFLDENGKPCANADGAAGLEYEYNDHTWGDYDKVLKDAQYFLNEAGERITVNGIYKILMRYNLNGQLTNLSLWDENDNSVNCAAGFSHVVMLYDENHNEIERSWYRAEKGIVQKIAALRSEYENGVFIGETMYDSEENLEDSLLGYAKMKRKYEHGYLVLEEFYDENENLCVGPNGYGRRELHLGGSEDGTSYFPERLCFYGEDETLCKSQMIGVAEVCYEYSHNGSMEKIIFKDEAGELCNNITQGIALVEASGWNGEFYNAVYWSDKDGKMIRAFEDLKREMGILGIDWNGIPLSIGPEANES